MRETPILITTEVPSLVFQPEEGISFEGNAFSSWTWWSDTKWFTVQEDRSSPSKLSLLGMVSVFGMTEEAKVHSFVLQTGWIRSHLARRICNKTSPFLFFCVPDELFITRKVREKFCDCLKGVLSLTPLDEKVNLIKIPITSPEPLGHKKRSGNSIRFMSSVYQGQRWV